MLVASTNAFNFGMGKKSATKAASNLPTFNTDTEKWVKSANDDGEYPYDAVGTLLRHGPSPFLTRTFNAQEYEQGILKYMASAKCDRSEATGNIDAKLNNAADWVYQKMEEKNGKPKVDFTRLDKKQAVLTAVWGLGITPLTISVIKDTYVAFTSH